MSHAVFIIPIRQQGQRQLKLTAMLSLFPDEEVIMKLTSKGITLTTHRIMKNEDEWGKSYNQSIMLEHITSCENNSTNNIVLFVIAAILTVFGFILMAQGVPKGIYILGIGIICVLIYHSMKKNLIVISSPSTRMKISVSGWDKGDILKFINRVERTKNQRIVSLSQRPNIIV